MILTTDQEALKNWLRLKIKWCPTPYARAIGAGAEDGRILGVMGFDTWNGASCQISAAGHTGWLTRKFLRAAFDYPFNVLKCNVIMAVTAETNKRALDIDRRLGFTIVARLPKANVDGDLLVHVMSKDSCKWIKE